MNLSKEQLEQQLNSVLKKKGKICQVLVATNQGGISRFYPLLALESKFEEGWQTACKESIKNSPDLWHAGYDCIIPALLDVTSNLKLRFNCLDILEDNHGVIRVMNSDPEAQGKTLVVKMHDIETTHTKLARFCQKYVPSMDSPLAMTLVVCGAIAAMAIHVQR